MTREELAEAIGGVRDEYIAGAREYKRPSKPAWLRWAAAAGVCLLLAGGYFISRPNRGQGGIDTPQPGGDSHLGVNEPDDGELFKPTNEIVINEPDSVMSCDMDVTLSYYDDDPDGWSRGFESNLGRSCDEFLAGMPEGYEIFKRYSVNTPDGEGGYVPHDYVFDFDIDNGSGEAVVALCAFEKPLRDCLFMDDDPKESVINGASLVIYNYSDMLMTVFCHDGLWYDVWTSGEEVSNLEALLTAIMS